MGYQLAPAVSPRAAPRAAHCGGRSELGWKPTTAAPRELCEIERYMHQAIALAAESAATGQVRLPYTPCNAF